MLYINNNKKKSIFFYFLVIWLSCSPVNSGFLFCQENDFGRGSKLNKSSIFFKMELFDFNELRNKVDIKQGCFRFLAVYTRKKGKSDYKSFGISSPWLTAGPVYSKGMISEIFNPLGYSPGSNVIKQRSGFNLDGSITGGTKKGLIFSPFPGFFTLFYLNSKKIRKFGGYFCIPFNEYVKIEYLSCLSNPDRDEVRESWFIDEPGFRGGEIINNAIKLLIKYPSFMFFFTFSISGGQLISRGMFTHISFLINKNFFSLESLSGYSDNYITPNGKPCNKAWIAGIDVFIKFSKFFWLGSEVNYKADCPGLKYYNYIPSDLEYLIKIRSEVTINKTAGLVFKSEYKRNIDFDKYGDCIKEYSMINGIQSRVSFFFCIV